MRINGAIEVILGSIYGPNCDDPKLFKGIETICNDMKGSEKIPVILGRDFNLVLNQRIDTINYRKENHPRATEMFQSMMIDNNWIYIFRELNGDKRAFTWKCGTQPRKQARLDYFLVSEILQPRVFEARVIPGYRSDHSMVTLEFSLTDLKRGKGYYKMNVSLLKDSEYHGKIKETIKETLATYALPVYKETFISEKPKEIDINISWSLFWEVLVLNMRTESITYSIHKTKKRNEEEKTVINNISRLENTDDSSITVDEREELEIHI